MPPPGCCCCCGPFGAGGGAAAGGGVRGAGGGPQAGAAGGCGLRGEGSKVVTEACAEQVADLRLEQLVGVGHRYRGCGLGDVEARRRARSR